MFFLDWIQDFLLLLLFFFKSIEYISLIYFGFLKLVETWLI